jgi:hypothetical protein
MECISMHTYRIAANISVSILNFRKLSTLVITHVPFTESKIQMRLFIHCVDLKFY